MFRVTILPKASESGPALLTCPLLSDKGEMLHFACIEGALSVRGEVFTTSMP